MKLVPLVLLLIPLPGCTTQVSHPTKSMAEQETDIDRCTREANRKYWMDPVAGLLNAYDCLEAMGYRKEKAGLKAQVERALSLDRGRRDPAEPAKPCSVPCRR